MLFASDGTVLDETSDSTHPYIACVQMIHDSFCDHNVCSMMSSLLLLLFAMRCLDEDEDCLAM